MREAIFPDTSQVANVLKRSTPNKEKLDTLSAVMPDQSLAFLVGLPQLVSRTSVQALHVERLKGLVNGGVEAIINGIARVQPLRRDNLGDSESQGVELVFDRCRVIGFNPPSNVLAFDVIVPVHIVEGVGVNIDNNEYSIRHQTL